MERAMGAINWEAVSGEVTGYLQDLIRIDTSNPPGNEIEAARYLETALQKEGYETVVLESAPTRGNIITSLSGDGSRDPFLLASHLDVVSANSAEWTHPPFSGTIADGYIWGRGTVDMKHMVAMSLMVMLLLKREGGTPRRNIIFAAVADEEAGGEYGAGWLVKNHPDLVRSEYGLNELGGFPIVLKNISYCPVQIAEKGFCWIRLKIKGEPGHGSLPHSNNAVVKLSRAIDRLGRQPFPHRKTLPTEKFIRAMAARQKFPLAQILKGLLSPLWNPIIVKFLIRDQSQADFFSALTHNTVSPTGLSAGSKNINVIPDNAEALIDGRILPGVSKEEFLSELERAAGQEVELEVLQDSSAAVADEQSPLFQAIVRTMSRLEPESVVVPYVVPGFTDNHHFMTLGSQMYGFTPMKLPEGEPFGKLIHGHDERIPVESLVYGTKILYELVKDFCFSD